MTKIYHRSRANFWDIREKNIANFAVLDEDQRVFGNGVRRCPIAKLNRGYSIFLPQNYPNDRGLSELQNVCSHLYTNAVIGDLMDAISPKNQGFSTYSTSTVIHIRMQSLRDLNAGSQPKSKKSGIFDLQLISLQ